jgi:predicted DNA-binding antitoxin AbrB/MazE fold protein
MVARLPNLEYPDLVCCLNGWMVAIEVKNEKGVVSPQQKVHIRNIIKAGGIAFVARSLEEVLTKLREEQII